MTDIQYTPAPNYQNQLRLADVWQPPSARDMMQIAAFGDQQQSHRIQNALAMKELELTNQEEGFASFIMDATSNVDPNKPVKKTVFGTVNEDKYAEGVKRFPKIASKHAAEQQKIDQTEQRQMEEKLFAGGVEMAKSEDSDISSKGVNIINFMGKKYGINLPGSGEIDPSVMSNSEYATKMQGIISDPNKSPEQKLKEAGSLGLQAKGKNQREKANMALGVIKPTVPRPSTTSDEPYKKGHIQEFKVGDETVYREYKGKDEKGNAKWEDRPEMGGKSKGSFESLEEAQAVAEKMWKATDKKAALIPSTQFSDGRYKPVLIPNIEVRIPPFSMGQMPGLVFNRRTGKYTWAEGGAAGEGGGNTQKLAEQTAAFKAYQQLQTDYARTGQVLKEAQMDAKTLISASDNFKRGDYPAPNKLITMGAEQLGSQERQKAVGNFKIALMAFSRKYMRAVTGAARSVAELSVGAQDTAETILSKFDSWTVLNSKVKQAQQEMKNTDTSYQDQFKELNDLMTGKSSISEPKEEKTPSKVWKQKNGKWVQE